MSMDLRAEHLAAGPHRCSFCGQPLSNPAFSYDVWDKMRFDDPMTETEEQWTEEAKSHEPDCPWVKHRGMIYWSA